MSSSNTRGCLAFDSETELWIEFKPPTDALVANLAFEHTFSLDTINIVLQTVMHPDLDLSQISLETPQTSTLGRQSTGDS